MAEFEPLAICHRAGLQEPQGGKFQLTRSLAHGEMEQNRHRDQQATSE